MAYRPFRSKTEAMNRAQRFHVCLSCRYNQPETFTNCPNCQAANRLYFPSKAEMHRAMQLLLLRDNGKITQLKFHPKYRLIVNDQDIAVYIADAEYYQDGKTVTEDSKPRNFMDKSAQIKIKLFEAIYERKVKLVKT